MTVIVSLDSPSCEVPCLILHSVVYQDVTRQAKGLHHLKYVGVLKRGLAYLSRCNSGWFCHRTGRRGPGKADDGEVRHDGDREQASWWEGERKRESRPVRTLTPRRNSGGSSREQRSGEAATATSVEVRRLRTRAARVSEARRRLRG
jgi:hypothetical protein